MFCLVNEDWNTSSLEELDMADVKLLVVNV
jgi:hypothetical protein